MLVPFAGRGSVNPAVGAHHSIAHQFLVNEHDPQHEFSDLLAELRDSPYDVAVISSENFECLHRSPESLREIAGGLASIGYEATVVLYVRDQAAYAESLYAEGFEHGSFLGIETFLRFVIDDALFTDKSHWHYAFDYPVLIEAFARAFGDDRVIVRRYPAGENASSLEVDFWHAAGVPSAIADDPMQMTPKVHPRMTFREALHKLHANAICKPVHAIDPDALLAIAGLQAASFLDEPFLALEHRDLERISERFAASNELLQRRYRLKLAPEIECPAVRPQRALLRLVAIHWNLS